MTTGKPFLLRARAAGVDRIIIPAIDLTAVIRRWHWQSDMPAYSARWASTPNSCADFSPNMLHELRSLAGHSSVIAIGEIGLDYYWNKCPQAEQRRALELQLELAADLQLPVILHNRESSDDLIAILEDWAPSVPPNMSGCLGVLHSFPARQQWAQRALALGFYLGFTGPITYKNAHELRAIAAGAPIDRVLVETDGPFLTPQQRRGPAQRTRLCALRPTNGLRKSRVCRLKPWRGRLP